MSHEQEVKIPLDDSFTDKVCNFCVGFLKFRVIDKTETAEPAGTGTFVKLGEIYGILTAAHVLKLMGENETVGLVRFPSIKPLLQNYRLELALTERFADWSGKDGDAPDIAFLKIPAVNGKALEALGAVFYNLAIAREFAVSTQENLMSKCYAVVGVVGEWTSDNSDAKAKKLEVGGLFGAAKNLKTTNENGAELAEVEVDHDEGPKVPTSYGGVSGGSLWELHVELDKDKKPVKVNTRLYGVAFRQSEDHLRITSNGPSAIDAVVKQIQAKWPEG